MSVLIRTGCAPPLVPVKPQPQQPAGRQGAHSESATRPFPDRTSGKQPRRWPRSWPAQTASAPAEAACRTSAFSGWSSRFGAIPQWARWVQCGDILCPLRSGRRPRLVASQPAVLSRLPSPIITYIFWFGHASKQRPRAGGARLMSLDWVCQGLCSEQC